MTRRRKKSNITRTREYYPNLNLGSLRSLTNSLSTILSESNSNKSTHGVLIKETLKTYQVVLYLKKDPRSPERGREIGKVLGKFILKHWDEASKTAYHNLVDDSTYGDI